MSPLNTKSSPSSSRKKSPANNNFQAIGDSPSWPKNPQNHKEHGTDFFVEARERGVIVEDSRQDLINSNNQSSAEENDQKKYLMRNVDLKDIHELDEDYINKSHTTSTIKEEESLNNSSHEQQDAETRSNVYGATTSNDNSRSNLYGEGYEGPHNKTGGYDFNNKGYW